MPNLSQLCRYGVTRARVFLRYKDLLAGRAPRSKAIHKNTGVILGRLLKLYTQYWKSVSKRGNSAVSDVMRASHTKEDEAIGSLSFLARNVALSASDSPCIE